MITIVGSWAILYPAKQDSATAPHPCNFSLTSPSIQYIWYRLYRRQVRVPNLRSHLYRANRQTNKDPGQSADYGFKDNTCRLWIGLVQGKGMIGITGEGGDGWRGDCTRALTVRVLSAFSNHLFWGGGYYPSFIPSCVYISTYDSSTKSPSQPERPRFEYSCAYNF